MSAEEATSQRGEASQADTQISGPPPPVQPTTNGDTTPGATAAPASATDPTTCPKCGAKTESGQLVCLECGERLALDYKRPPSWRLPAIVVGLVLLLAGAGLAIALSRIGDNAGDVAKAPEPTQQLQTASPTAPTPTVTTNTSTPSASKPPTTKTPKIKPPKISTTPSVAPPSPTPTPAPSPAPTPTPTPTGTSPTDTTPAAGEVAAWPAGRTAYTVVLLSLKDQDAANRAARRATAKGLDGVGVLNSDDYSTLNPGFFVVFHDQFRFRKEADKQTVRDAREGYDQAYARKVRPNAH